MEFGIGIHRPRESARWSGISARLGGLIFTLPDGDEEAIPGSENNGGKGKL